MEDDVSNNVLYQSNSLYRKKRHKHWNDGKAFIV
jgi:hypothetical protein